MSKSQVKSYLKTALVAIVAVAAANRFAQTRALMKTD